MDQDRVSLYVLDEYGRAVQEPDPAAWMEWIAQHQERLGVAIEVIGNVKVSTAFMGMTLGSDEEGKPLLWQTMIIGGVMHGRSHAYRDRQEAELGHAAAARLVRLTEDRRRRNGCGPLP